MKWPIAHPLYDAPNDASGAGSAPAGTAPSTTPSSAPAGTSPASASPVPAGNQPPAGTAPAASQPAAKQFTYTEDRSDWIPRHRLSQVSQRTQQLQQQLEESQRRIQALAGVAPVDANAQEAEEVRTAFKQMFPHLAKLDDQRIDRLLKLADQSDQLETTANHHWQQHTQRMVGALETEIAEQLGVDELTPRQRQRLGEAYANALNRDYVTAQREGRQSDLLRRHEAGDQTLIAEFAKEWVEDFVEPVRRRATAAQVQRVGVRVPSGRSSQNVSTITKPKIDFTNEQAVEDAAVAAFQQHGGMFSRR